MTVLQQTLLGIGVVTPVYNTLWDLNLVTDTAITGKTVVVITPLDITDYNSFIITLKNSTDPNGSIDDLYVGQLSGLYSFASTPTRATWGGSAATSYTFTAEGEFATTNPISYTPSGTGKLCISFHVNSSMTMVKTQNTAGGGGYATYTKSAGSPDSGTVSKTGYSGPWGTARLTSISKIEAATV